MEQFDDILVLMERTVQQGVPRNEGWLIKVFRSQRKTLLLFWKIFKFLIIFFFLLDANFDP